MQIFGFVPPTLLQIIVAGLLAALTVYVMSRKSRRMQNPVLMIIVWIFIVAHCILFGWTGPIVLGNGLAWVTGAFLLNITLLRLPPSPPRTFFYIFLLGVWVFILGFILGAILPMFLPRF
jgi:hypothetical protein